MPETSIYNKKKKIVSSQGQHWFIHKTSPSEQKDDEAANRLTLTSQLFLELYCTLSERPPQPLYPSCFEKLAGRDLAKALVAVSCTDREVYFRFEVQEWESGL